MVTSHSLRQQLGMCLQGEKDASKVFWSFLAMQALTFKPAVVQKCFRFVHLVALTLQSRILKAGVKPTHCPLHSIYHFPHADAPNYIIYCFSDWHCENGRRHGSRRRRDSSSRSTEAKIKLWTIRGWSVISKLHTDLCFAYSIYLLC